MESQFRDAFAIKWMKNPKLLFMTPSIGFDIQTIEILASEFFEHRTILLVVNVGHGATEKLIKAFVLLIELNDKARVIARIIRPHGN